MVYFSKNITYLRKSRNLTQTEFAQSIGTKKTTYSNYENDYSRPDFETLYLISKFYGLTAEQILYIDLEKQNVLGNETMPNNDAGDTDVGMKNIVQNLQKQIGIMQKEIEELKKKINRLSKD